MKWLSCDRLELKFVGPDLNVTLLLNNASADTPLSTVKQLSLTRNDAP